MKIPSQLEALFPEKIFIMEYKTILKKAGAIFIALAFWQIAAMTIKQNILLVSPIEVLFRLTTIWKTEGFFSSMWFSFARISIGFLLGLIIGSLMAFFANRYSLFETLLWPFVVTVKTVPVASFVVICLVWLSARNLSVLISFMIVFPIVYQNILTGLRARDKKLIEMADVFKVTGIRRLKLITIPELSKYIATASSITIGMAWKAGIAAEIIGTPAGSIGKQLHTAKMYLDTDDLLAWTVVLVILSVISEKIFIYLLKRGLKYDGDKS